MRKKKDLLNRIPFLIIAAGYIISVFSLFQFITGKLITTEQVPTISNAAIITDKQKIEVSLPVRLIIPKIGVDANIDPIGVTAKGIMDSPKEPDDAAWFSLGPVPGEKGSAVISGHYGWKNNIKAVFDNLSELRKGDKIYIENSKGKITTFVVRTHRTYDQNANAAEIFGSSDGKSRLNLITCKGTWNKIEKSYSERLVIFAEKE